MFAKIIKIVGWALVCLVLILAICIVFSAVAILLFFISHKVALLTSVYTNLVIYILVAVVSIYFILKRFIKGPKSVKIWLFGLSLVLLVLTCYLLAIEIGDLAFIAAFAGG